MGLDSDVHMGWYVWYDPLTSTALPLIYNATEENQTFRLKIYMYLYTSVPTNVIGVSDLQSFAIQEPENS